MLTARGYELPSWAPAGSAVLCSSYSGNTEETLGCYAAAEALGAHRLVATTGGELAELARADDVPVIGLPAGLQPRAAVGYMFCVAAELAALALAGPRIHTEIDAAASHLGRAFEADGGPRPRARRRDRRRHPGDLRQRPHRPGRLSLGDADQRERQGPRLLGGPAGGRPQPAGGLGPARRSASPRSSSEDRDQHPRERKRLELTAKAIEPSAAAVHRRRDGGREPHRARAPHGHAGRPARDRAGEARGVDPLAVDLLEGFKKEMGRPDGCSAESLLELHDHRVALLLADRLPHVGLDRQACACRRPSP